MRNFWDSKVLILSWTSWLSQIVSEKQSENLSVFRISCITLKLIQTTTPIPWYLVWNQAISLSLRETWSFSFLSQEMVVQRWNRLGPLWRGSPWIRSTIYNSVIRHQCSGGTSCNYSNHYSTYFFPHPGLGLHSHWNSLDELEILSSSSDLNVKHQLALYVTHYFSWAVDCSSPSVISPSATSGGLLMFFNVSFLCGNNSDCYSK